MIFPDPIASMSDGQWFEPHITGEGIVSVMRLRWFAQDHAISNCFHGCPWLLLSPNWNSLGICNCKVVFPKISRTSQCWKFIHGQKRASSKVFASNRVSHIPDLPRRCSLLPLLGSQMFFWFFVLFCFFWFQFSMCKFPTSPSNQEPHLRFLFVSFCGFDSLEPSHTEDNS